jgi:hypothetical protein
MFKAITKALTLRFTPPARQVISSLHTGFIPRMYILDGCVILHEVLHELKTSHSEGIWLKLDFEKAYDRVGPFLAEVMTSYSSCSGTSYYFASTTFNLASIGSFLNRHRSF